MPIRINLLAEAQAAEELRRRDPVKRVIWVAIIIVAVVLFWASYLQARIITDKSRLSNLQGKLSSETNQYTQIIANRNRLNDVNTKLVALSRLATNRFLDGTMLDSLQHATVDGIQIVKLHTEQAYELVAATKPGENGKPPGKPASSTEKIKLLLDAKDTSPNPGTGQMYKYIDTLARTPYFHEQRISTNEIQLKNCAPPATDNETGKPYVLFTLECQFPDRRRD